MVRFKCIIVNTLNKGQNMGDDDDDDDDDDDNNNNVFTLSTLIKRKLSSRNVNYSYIGANVIFPRSCNVITTDRVV